MAALRSLLAAMLAAACSTAALPARTSCPFTATLLPAPQDKPLPPEVQGKVDAVRKAITENPSIVSSVARGVAAAEAANDPNDGREPAFGNMFNVVGEGLHAEEFLKNLSLELRAFENEGAETSLGLAFAYDKSQSFGGRDAKGIPKGGGSFKLRANGTVAFDDRTNPEDFLVAEVALGYSLANTPEWRGTEEQYSDYMKRITAALGKPEEVAAITREMRDHVDSNYYFLEGELHAGFESNQRFTARNQTIGGSLWVDLKSYDNDSWFSRLNLLDYPFALTRYLSNYEREVSGYDELTPRGSSFPYLRARLHLVEPEGADPRAAVGDTTAFTRLTLEAGMRTPFLRFRWDGEDQRLDASFSYRYFKELDASQAVRAADLDTYEYFAVAITHQKGFFATYRSGRLPFDAMDDNAFEVGWKFDF